jgi:acetyl-CoA acetyltransferase
MREAFGRHTAATASRICDGAAALLVVNERGLKLLGGSAKPLARVHQMTVLGVRSSLFSDCCQRQRSTPADDCSNQRLR